MLICLERGADLHIAQLMPLPLTVSCFSKITISFAFLVPAHPGSPGQRAVKRVCVCVCVWRRAVVHCPELIDVENATRDTNDTHYDKRVIYSCLPGYHWYHWLPLITR